MKTKTLTAQPCWHVGHWDDKIIRGTGYALPRLNTGWYVDSDKYLFFPEDKPSPIDKLSEINRLVPRLVDAKCIYHTKAAAREALAKEQEEYADFCRKQIKEYSDTLQELLRKGITV